MPTELTVTRANPAGNLTLLVSGSVPAEKRAAIGAQLLAMPSCRAEQTGFIVPPVCGGMGRLEMSGGEFCGNAVRSFGLMLAQQKGMQGTIPVEISGCPAPVAVTVDPVSGTVLAEMPLPETIGMIALPAPFGIRPLIRFSGIWHLLAEDIPATEKNFVLAKDAVYTRWDPDAFGVMFLSENSTFLTPYVFVRSSGTLFCENSCGSGSAAVAVWAAANGKAGTLSLRQPGGVLDMHTRVQGGILRSVSLESTVSLEAPVTVSLTEEGIIA